jgi:hypothetical protein
VQDGHFSPKLSTFFFKHFDLVDFPEKLDDYWGSLEHARLNRQCKAGVHTFSFERGSTGCFLSM